MAIIPYARVSSTKQIDGLSLELQSDEGLLESIAKKFNTTVSDKFYADSGVSSFKGKNAKQGEFGKLLEDIDAKIIKSGDIIVMRSLDRMSRQNIVDAENLYNRVMGAGVKIYTTMDSRLYDDSDDGATSSAILKVIALSTANEESKKKSFLTNDYARKRIEQFKSGQRSDDGLVFDIGIARHPFWIGLENKCIVKGELFDKARLLFDKAITGMGSTRLANYAHSIGIKISTSQANKMFNKASVYGDLVVMHKQTEHVLKGFYPALISEEEFYKLQAVKSKTIKSSSAKKRVSLLSGQGKLFCSCCNSAMVVGCDTRLEINYYQCSNRLTKCFTPLRQDTIDTLVLKMAQSLLVFDDDTDTSLLDGLIFQRDEKKKKLDSTVKQMLMLGVSDDDGDSSRVILDNLRSDISELENKIDNERSKKSHATISNEALADFGSAVEFYLEKASGFTEMLQEDHAKRDLREKLGLMIKRININDKHIIEVEFYTDTKRILLLRRRSGKNYERFFVELKVLDDDTVNDIRLAEPKMNHVIKLSELADLNLSLEDVVNPLPVIDKVVQDYEKEFFDLLVGDVYEWKRASIMNVGATSTQWQQFKDFDVQKYGFTKVDAVVTTKHYTKQSKTFIYKKGFDLTMLDYKNIVIK